MPLREQGAKEQGAVAQNVQVFSTAMNSRYGPYFAVLLWFCDTVVGIPRRRKIECMASTNLLKQRETRIHVVNAGWGFKNESAN